VERYERLTSFAEAQILPRSGEGSAAFYLPGTRRLRPQFEAYHERRMAVQQELGADVEWVRMLLADFEASPTAADGS